MRFEFSFIKDQEAKLRLQWSPGLRRQREDVLQHTRTQLCCLRLESGFSAWLSAAPPTERGAFQHWHLFSKPPHCAQKSKKGKDQWRSHQLWLWPAKRTLYLQPHFFTGKASKRRPGNVCTVAPCREAPSRVFPTSQRHRKTLQ